MKKFLIITSILILPSIVSASTFSVSPTTQTVKVGETFTINVRLDTQGTFTQGVDLRYLNFDPTLLQVEDAKTASAGIQISPGILMPSTVLNSTNNTLGRISFSQIASGGNSYIGSGILATVTFKAIAGGNARVTFSFTPNSTTDSNVALEGADTLTSVTNGSYIIQGTAPRITPSPTIIPSRIVPPPSSSYTSPTRRISSPQKNTNPVPPAKRNILQGYFVPVQDTYTIGDDSHSSFISYRQSFRDIIDYVYNRIRRGVTKVFNI